VFGFVKKSTLIAVQKQLEKEIEKLESPKVKDAIKMINLESRIKELKSDEIHILKRIEASKAEAIDILIAAKNEANLLKEKTIADAQRESNRLIDSAETDSQKALKGIEISKTEAIDILIAAKNEANLLKEKTIADAQRESNRLIESAETDSQKALKGIEVSKTEAIDILIAAKNEANLLKEKTIADAQRESNRLIDSAETHSQKALVDRNAELRVKENEINDISMKLNDYSIQLKSLESEIENYDLISTITPFSHIVDGPVSEKIKEKFEIVKEKQKELIRSNAAFEILQPIYWNDSKAKGSARQKRLVKFLVTAFNSEVDNIISNTTSRNFAFSAKSIEKWFDKVNKGGADDFVRLNREILALRLEEHRCAFEYRIKKEMEVEDQRYMRETIREENKVKKEIEEFVKAREKEEKAFQKDLDTALVKIKSSNEAEVIKLKKYIEELHRKIEISTNEKERAMSMAQLTRSGYVYIISNKGSFGEGIYKIGMTRRLDPMDRVKELGDASVPFFFDVHGMIPYDDAPKLEKLLHERFASKRINKVNYRREYFKVEIDEIEIALKDIIGEEFELTYDAVAEQYEESLLIEKEAKVA
jgi:hypothetical protein